MTQNLQIVRAYMAHIATGDIESALALAADDATFQGPDGQSIDKNGLRALFAMLGDQLVNPLEQEEVGTTCEGDRVAVESKARTLLANGNVYSNLYHFLFVVRDGLIRSSSEYCNTRATDAFAA
jgi:ketosteroid isomerase-like protein